MALTDSLVAYWRLDEASGSRADAVGSATLTDNNTVGSAAGNISALAAAFVAASSEYLSTTNATAAGTVKGSASWTLTAWINPTDVLNTRTGACGTFDAAFSGLQCIRRAPYVAVDGANADQIYWQFWNDGGTPYTAEVTGTSGRTIAGQWSFISCQFDSATGKMRSRTNATASSDVTLSGTFSANAQFDIGRRGSGGQYFTGSIAHVGLWSRALTSGELDTLYNSGAGMDPTNSQSIVPHMSAGYHWWAL